MASSVTRRVFLERLGACAAGAAAGSQLLTEQATAQSGQAWAAPQVLSNPNILIILVDQMRMPLWLTSSQLTTLDQVFLPNILGKIRDHSYAFQQYYTAANNCVPSRATLLTGLYAPQTALYLTSTATSSPPPLNTAFPTWGTAVQKLNTAYANNAWWFGKWHLSSQWSVEPLLPYGFKTGNYPGGPAANPSPNGLANEGTNGGVNEVAGPSQGLVFASDAEIAADFSEWVTTSTATGQPWCATVSFINPHDIAFAPGALVDGYVPPSPGKPAFPLATDPPAFPPSFLPSGTAPLLSNTPSPWNWENLSQVPGKPPIQLAYQKAKNKADGVVTDWTLFLNQYYWLQSYVDQQVGKVLAALQSSGQAGNTILVFASDHGEYGGSHGMHDKGFAAYDEALRVPLCVQFPGQQARFSLNQMCSSVDFFGLVCDLATSGKGSWKNTYPDLARRQSLWSFIYKNTAETRTAAVAGPNNPPAPYILFTCDEVNPNEQCSSTAPSPNSHIVCIRTKYQSNTAVPGAKLAIYSEWAPNTTYPDSNPQDVEFYDYNPATTGNRSEKGNDALSTNQTVIDAIGLYTSALGAWTPPTGLIGSELNRPLVGKDANGNPLTLAQSAAQQAYFTFLATCPA
ncbi:MAG: sulfatase-like hydrolase/transferase [Bryobacteraceae bacterium]